MFFFISQGRRNPAFFYERKEMDYNNEDEDKKVNEIVDKLMSYHPNWEKLKGYLEPVSDKIQDIKNNPDKFAKDFFCINQLNDFYDTAMNTDYKRMLRKANDFSGFKNSLKAGGLNFANGYVDGNLPKYGGMVIGSASSVSDAIDKGSVSDVVSDYRKKYNETMRNINDKLDEYNQEYGEISQFAEDLGDMVACVSKVVSIPKKGYDYSKKFIKKKIKF